MSFNFTCSHCKATLQAEDDWAGRETVCPVCQKKVMILRDPLPDDTLPLRQPPPREAASEATSQATKKAVEAGKKPERFTGKRNASHFHWLGGGRKYFWGRLFIFLTWVQAVFWWLVGIGLVILFMVVFNSDKEAKYKDVRKKIPGLQESQKKFAKDLMDTIDLLAAKRKLDSGANGGITGFQLPQSIRQTAIVFNEDLETIAEVDESLETVNDCINNIIPQIQEAIQKDLMEQLHGLQLLINGQIGHSRSPAQLNPSRGRVGAIQIGSFQQVNFYNNQEEVRNAIEAIRKELASVKQLYPDNVKMKNDLDTLSRFLDFIQLNLLNQDSRRQMKQQEGKFSSTPSSQPQERKKVKGEEEYNYITELLAELYLAQHDKVGWKIAKDAKTLKNDLDQYKNDLDTAEKELETEFYICSGLGLASIIIFTVLGFLLLVIADVLRAHFDCAEFTLQKQGE